MGQASKNTLTGREGVALVDKESGEVIEGGQLIYVPRKIKMKEGHL